MQSEPVIGVICDHSSAVLAGRIRAAGYRITRVMPENLVQGELPAVSAWVIDCGDNTEVAEAMTWIEPQVLALSNRPDPSQLLDYKQWCERIIRTLDKWTADFWHAQVEPSPSSAQDYALVQGVWILAGSTGALGAVSEFFRAFTHIPPVAFIYAQHIHADQQHLLTTIGRANRDLVCSLALGRHWLNAGQVLSKAAVRAPRLVHRGDVVEIVAVASGVRVRTRGTVLEDGSRSQLVTVQSLDRKKKFSARVVDFGRVEIFAGAVKVTP